MRNQRTSGGLERIFGAVISVLVHVAIFSMFLLSSGSEESKMQEETPNTVYCRYIDNGRLFQVEVHAVDWQEAEDKVCGAQKKDVHLSPLLLEGALLILEDQANDVIYAQRESCSCSDKEEVPILQDVSIVEAPRLGSETKKTALPRIINTPEPSQENTVTTAKDAVKKKADKPVKKTPNIDDLLNAATDFDEARPVSEIDPGGSLDGSKLSKSATGKGDPYLQKVKAKLDNTMVPPATLPKAQLQKLKAQVWIKIGDNGVVWGWDFIRKSGNSSFDRMIEATIKQFMMGGQLRFANPPEQWRLQNIPFTVDGSEIK